MQDLKPQRAITRTVVAVTKLPTVDILQVTPPSIIERKPDPMVTPRRVLLVFFALALTLGTIEVLFRCTIYER